MEIACRSSSFGNIDFIAEGCHGIGSMKPSQERRQRPGLEVEQTKSISEVIGVIDVAIGGNGQTQNVLISNQHLIGKTSTLGTQRIDAGQQQRQKQSGGKSVAEEL